MSELSLHRQDSAVLKGIAIIAMLLHHMYGDPPPGVASYGGILEWIGILGKVCVALFLFCSGYGLAANYKTVSFVEDMKFIGRRMVKFYLNYWVIFVVFIPITIFCFHRPLSAAYGDDYVLGHLAIDLFGLQGWQSYNVTWWFNALIIILYLMFPLMYRVIVIKPWVFFLLSMAMMRYADHMPYNIAELDICLWQFPFILGVVLKCYESKGTNVQKLLVEHRTIAICLSLCILCGVVAIRMYPIIPHWSGIRIDGFLSCAIALCVITIIRNLKYTTNVLAFFGKHSMNIYMTHTFLNWYWCKEWLHAGEWLRGGGNLLILTLLCLAISIAIEFLKQKIGIYKLTKYITDKL